MSIFSISTISSADGSGPHRPTRIEAAQSCALARFATDERGSYTLWSIVWFMLFAAFGGLATDTTDAYRNQTLLQSTADAAALAAVMSVDKVGEDPIAQANAYATANMTPSVNGDVLADNDITLGNYDLPTKTFTAGATPINAVHVVTRRTVDNDNPVAMNFLRILGLFGLDPFWNVAAEAVAVGAISPCHNNGLIAGGALEQSSQNSYFNNMCLHGVEGMLLRNDNYFESGVSTSTTCKDCVGPDGSDPSVNEGWDEAWWRGGENEPLYPLNAHAVDEYVDVLKDLPYIASYDAMIDTYGERYAGWRYLFHPDGSPPAEQFVDGNSLPDTLDPYTVYVVTCNGNLKLPSTPMRNVGILSSCPVQVPASQTIDAKNVAIIADFDSTNDGIHFAGGSSSTRPAPRSNSPRRVTLATCASSRPRTSSGQPRPTAPSVSWARRWVTSA